MIVLSLENTVVILYRYRMFNYKVEHFLYHSLFYIIAIVTVPNAAVAILVIYTSSSHTTTSLLSVRRNVSLPRKTSKKTSS